MVERAVIFTMPEKSVVVMVLFFASLKELVGSKVVSLSVPASTDIHRLREILADRYPKLASRLPFALCSYNHQYVNDDQVVDESSEIGFFPPVSGGAINESDIVVLTPESLDMNQILKSLSTEETGAACVFTGFVRGKTLRGSHHETIKLEYESYIPMAEMKMHQICTEMHERWPMLKRIYLVQRLGTLEPGEVTTAVGCSSSHRDEGIFEAAKYGIDRMKEIVPVWKKEIGRNDSEWVEGHYKPVAGE